jgi:hypothetical protein
MSLTSCLRKAGALLSPEDRAAVLDSARANRAAGMDATAAGAKAINDQLAEVERLLRVAEARDGLDNLPADASEEEQDAADTAMRIAQQVKASPARPFYSELARRLDGASMNAAPAAGWKQWLKGLPAKGVKPDEIEWSGVEDWLDMQQGKVAKADVQAFLSANGVQVEETVLGAERYEIVENEDGEFDVIAVDKLIGGEPRVMFTGSTMEDARAYRYEASQSGNGNEPKYGQYQLPGGTNYREVLLTLPKGTTYNDVTPIFRAAGISLDADVVMAGGNPNYRLRKWGAEEKVDPGTLQGDAAAAWKKLTSSSKEAFIAELARTNSWELPLNEGRQRRADNAWGMQERKQPGFKSNHWEQPNVLAHIRLNDRTDADGKRVLFVEEIQSDWGQAGKKKGFAQPAEARGQLVEKMALLQGQLRDMAQERAKAEGISEAEAHKALYADSEDYRRKDELHQRSQQVLRENRFGVNGIPNAPFVGATDKWLGLALKRVIKLAVDEGYDKVAFINGDQSAERYDLSKQISGVILEKSGALMVNVIHANHKAWTPIAYTALDDVIGKELAQRLKDATPNSHGARSLSGLDLKIGGEGMKAFYDKLVPIALKDLLKKLGGGVVGEVEIAAHKDSVSGGKSFTYGLISDAGSEETSVYRIREEQRITDPIGPDDIVAGPFPTNDAARAWLHANDPATRNVLQQPGFTITPTMREKAGPGLPLFSRQRATEERDGTWDAGTPTKLDKFIRVMQDKHVDAKRVLAAVKDQITDLAEQWDVYLQEELYHGRAAKRTKDFLDFELRPLLKDMVARGVKIDELQTYLHNRHAEERNDQIAKVNDAMPDGGSGIKTADAQAYLAALAPAKKRAYEALAKRVDAINAATESILVKSGLEKQETIDAWNGAYKHYVPLNRTEFEDDPNRGTGQGMSVKGGASRRAMGSEKEVGNIMANVAAARERTIVRAEKNRVASALYGLTIKAPKKGFWMPFAPDRMKNQAGIEAELVDMGMSPEEAAEVMAEPKKRQTNPRTGKVTYVTNPLLRNADNVVSVRIGGEDRFVLFNHQDDRAMRMVRGLKNLDVAQLGAVLNISAKISRWFASVNTQYNPIFGVVNLLRDTQGALVNLSTTEIAGEQAEVLKGAGSALIGIYSDIRAHRKGAQPSSKWAQLWEEFQKEGGQTGYRDQYANPKERNTALEAELKKISEGRAMGAGRAVFDWLSDYNDTMENAVRLSAYKVAKDKGLSNAKAASIAKNLTVNFNRKGEVAQQAGALYAFFNASAQGTARMAETLKGPMGKRIVAGGLLLGVMQALMLSAAGMGEDEPPEFIRDRNLILPIGDGKYLSMPMPLGLHVIPSFSRRITELLQSGGRDSGAKLVGMFGLFADAFNPIGNAGLSMQTFMPTPGDWAAALFENKDFSGREIATKDRVGTDPTPGHMRAKNGASGVSKVVSYYLNKLSGGTDYKPGVISPTPDQLDYLVGQVGGGLVRETGKLSSTTSAMQSGEELPPHKVPLLGRFFGDTTGQASVSAKYYKNITRMNEHENELKGRREHPEKGDTPMAYLRENPEAKLVGYANSVERVVARDKALKRKMIDRGTDAAYVRVVEARITAAMRRLNDKLAAQED